MNDATTLTAWDFDEIDRISREDLAAMARTIDEEQVYLRPTGFYDDQDITLLTATRVAAIDADSMTLRMEGAGTLSADQIALTTGADPICLPGISPPSRGRDGAFALKACPTPSTRPRRPPQPCWDRARLCRAPVVPVRSI